MGNNRGRPSLANGKAPVPLAPTMGKKLLIGLVRLLCGTLLLALSGCFVPQTQLNDCQAQNRALSEQNRAQLAEIENLRVHSHNVEDRLMRSEEEYGLLQERVGLDGKQLANYQRECSTLQEQFNGVMTGGPRASAVISRQLAELSQRYPNLKFDPVTGMSKLDSDILFESGEVELKPGAKELVEGLVRILKSPEGSDLKVVVVGHTDDRQVAKKPARDKYPDNFHLSTARALAVADLMQQAGLPQQRLGVAGMGGHEPIASNTTPKDRQRNRRVEIFVTGRDVPVVGWSETIPTMY
jgi:chemotaxis protein MotB